MDGWRNDSDGERERQATDDDPEVGTGPPDGLGSISVGVVYPIS